MDHQTELQRRYLETVTRRHFLRRCNSGLGAAALAALIGPRRTWGAATTTAADNPLLPKQPPLPAKAKAVIYLHMSGSPPQHDLFDWKPKLVELNMQPCPESLLKGQRFAFIKSVPKLLGTPHKFIQHGQSGAWVSSMLPHFSRVVDDVAFIKSMHTDQFNHAPAELLVHTGLANPGNASIGSWVTYGLGSENQNLPGYVVLVSGGADPTAGKSVWGSGFLPSVYQGVQCRSVGEPILYVSDPSGMDRAGRRRSLDALRRLNEMELAQVGDPETLTRIAQYELAYRMQVTVPEVMDIGRETQQTLDLYGAKPGEGSFASNCLLARRLVEQGVRYVQLFDWGWDMHGTDPNSDLVTGLPNKCQTIDRAMAALIRDLKCRGLLDETLVVWGGEFGRTSMNEERNGSKLLGRDHHPHCFTVWMAGAGIKPGITYGATDELGYFVAQDKMEVHDLQATILHLLGFDPLQFSYPDQGLNVRLIGPAEGPRVHHGLLA